MAVISIIIPHYNSFNSLEKLILSIGLKKSIQILVIDDNSDNINELKKIQQKYTHVEFLQNNQGRGAGNCRNLGLKNATGDWVIFADADDYLLPGWYNKVLDITKNKNHLDIIFFKPISMYLDGELSNRHLPYERLVDNYLSNRSEDIRFWYHVPWSKVYNRNFLISNNITFSKHIVSNDVLFSVKSGILCNKFHVENSRIYCVTDGDGSLTKSSSKERLLVRLGVLRDFNDILRANNYSRYQIPTFVILRRLIFRTPFTFIKQSFKDIFSNNVYFYNQYYLLKKLLK